MGMSEIVKPDMSQTSLDKDFAKCLGNCARDQRTTVRMRKYQVSFFQQIPNQYPFSSLLSSMLSYMPVYYVI